jgi:hypothetical protein
MQVTKETPKSTKSTKFIDQLLRSTVDPQRIQPDHDKSTLFRAIANMAPNKRELSLRERTIMQVLPLDQYSYLVGSRLTLKHYEKLFEPLHLSMSLARKLAIFRSPSGATAVLL